jgi:hypothetical protein
MKLVTYSDKSVLVGDEAADSLVRFAALIADKGRADAVSLNVIAPDGEAIVTSFVLGSGIAVMAESTNSPLPEPDNDQTVATMNAKLEELASSPRALPTSEPFPEDGGVLDRL